MYVNCCNHFLSTALKWLPPVATVIHFTAGFHFISPLSWQFGSSPAITSLHFGTNYHYFSTTYHFTKTVILIRHELSLHYKLLLVAAPYHSILPVSVTLFLNQLLFYFTYITTSYRSVTSFYNAATSAVT